MATRNVYRIPRQAITQAIRDAAQAAGCPEIELRDDIDAPVVYVEVVVEPEEE